jgi:hypothetical protein
MKVLIFIPVWKRFPEAALTYEGVHRIQDVLLDSGIESTVLVVSSEEEHTKMALSQDFEAVECENFPVSDKHNCGLNYALEYEWDYLFQMGSNNLLSTEYVKELAKGMLSNTYDMIGTDTLFNVLEDRKNMTIFQVRRPHSCIGVGRMISRKSIESAILSNRTLWKPGLNRGLDKSSQDRLNIPKEKVKITECQISVVDIRTSEDINVMNRRPKPIKKEAMIKHFPELKSII